MNPDLLNRKLMYMTLHHAHSVPNGTRRGKKQQVHILEQSKETLRVGKNASSPPDFLFLVINDKLIRIKPFLERVNSKSVFLRKEKVTSVQTATGKACLDGSS